MAFSLGDFAAGAAKGASEDLDRREQTALELKLRSSLLEQQLAGQSQLSKQSMEQQNALADLQEQRAEKLRTFELNQMKVPDNEFSYINKKLGTFMNAAMQRKPIPDDALDFSQIKSEQGQQYLSQHMGMVTAMAQHAGLHFATEFDPMGRSKVVGYDQRTGQKVVEGQAELPAATAGKLLAARSAYFSLNNFADTTMNQLEGKLAEPSGNPVIDALRLQAQRGQISINQLTQKDPGLKAFMDQLAYKSAKLDKDTVGSMRAAGLMDKTGPAIFSKDDSIQTVRQKMLNFKQMGLDQASAAYSGAGMPVDKDILQSAGKLVTVMPHATQAKADTLGDVNEFNAWKQGQGTK